MRSRVASPPRGSDIRPTPDALREQAFAILARDMPAATFLDFYAGTGIVSLEALSRGAARAIMCEHSPAAQRLIRRNLETVGVSGERWELCGGAVEASLAQLARRGVAASVAWCDPPFAVWASALPMLELARTLGVLVPRARVVLETPPKAGLDVPGFEVLRQLRGALLLACR